MTSTDNKLGDLPTYVQEVGLEMPKGSGGLPESSLLLCYEICFLHCHDYLTPDFGLGARSFI